MPEMRARAREPRTVEVCSACWSTEAECECVGPGGPYVPFVEKAAVDAQVSEQEQQLRVLRSIGLSAVLRLQLLHRDNSTFVRDLYKRLMSTFSTPLSPRE